MARHPTPPLCEGTSLPGGYTVEQLLDEGAFARVYRGRGPAGQAVAIKVLKRLESQPRKRFAREVKVTRALPRSPYVVEYHHHGVLAGDVPFLVLEFIDGYTLAQLLRSGHVLTEKQACAMMTQLCESFGGLHKLGVTHGDIKPQNIMLDRIRKRVKLLDFGLVRDSQGLLKLFESENILPGTHFHENLDEGMLMGTPEYMAPEQIADAKLEDWSKARTDTPADVYGLGVIFYELLSGRRPFPFHAVPGTPRELKRQMLRFLDTRLAGRDALPPLGNITPQLWSIVSKALRHDPKLRQGDARVLQADIERYVDSGAGIPDDLDEETTISATFEQVRDYLAEASGLIAKPDFGDDSSQNFGDVRGQLHRRPPRQPSAPPSVDKAREARRGIGAEWWITGGIVLAWIAVMVALVATGVV